MHPKSTEISGTTIYELLKRVDDLESQAQHQTEYNLLLNDKIHKLEHKVQCLEGQLMVVNSRFSVRDHVIEALQNEVQRLQQYTRRYTVSVVGVGKKENERPEELREEVIVIVIVNSHK